MVLEFEPFVLLLFTSLEDERAFLIERGFFKELSKSKRELPDLRSGAGLELKGKLAENRVFFCTFEWCNLFNFIGSDIANNGGFNKRNKKKVY